MKKEIAVVGVTADVVANVADRPELYAVLNRDVVIAACTFSPGGKVYTYKALRSQNLQVGDVVVVETGRGINGVTVERVYETSSSDFNPSIAYKWVIQKVDFSAWQGTVDIEEAFYKELEALSAAKVAKANEDARRQQLQNLREDLGESLMRYFPEETASPSA